MTAQEILHDLPRQLTGTEDLHSGLVHLISEKIGSAIGEILDTYNQEIQNMTKSEKELLAEMCLLTVQEVQAMYLHFDSVSSSISEANEHVLAYVQRIIDAHSELGPAFRKLGVNPTLRRQHLSVDGWELILG